MESVLDEDLYWRFSLAVYRDEGVARSCLALQAEVGLDVNVLLMSLLAARWHRRPILRDEIEQADARVQAWRRDVVAPLRAVRSRLKSGPPPAPDPHTDALRNEVKAAELRAERIEQQALAAWIDALAPAIGQRIARVEDCLDTADRVVELYLARAPACDAEAELRGWACVVARACAGFRDACLTDPRGG
ncbi:TIGR02444 family protein [Castellaniella sp.]|uniref:TIGR02444 family protein n=1 Tax=Castellaniella sp. TaxID=1955812 RepID=UPI003C790B17